MIARTATDAEGGQASVPMPNMRSTVSAASTGMPVAQQKPATPQATAATIQPVSGCTSPSMRHIRLALPRELFWEFGIVCLFGILGHLFRAGAQTLESGLCRP